MSFLLVIWLACAVLATIMWARFYGRITALECLIIPIISPVLLIGRLIHEADDTDIWRSK